MDGELLATYSLAEEVCDQWFRCASSAVADGAEPTPRQPRRWLRSFATASVSHREGAIQALEPPSPARATKSPPHYSKKAFLL